MTGMQFEGPLNKNRRSLAGGGMPGVAVLAVLLQLAITGPSFAVVLTGGPVYTLPGGGSCTVSGIASGASGASISCTGMALGGHTKVYFGIRNDTNVNGNTMTGAQPSGSSIFRYSSSTTNSITYTSSGSINDQINGAQTVSNQLVLTLTSGTATVVPAGGTPGNTGNGDIERLFRITSGSSFAVRADVKASNSFHSLGYALPAVYDPTNTPLSGSADVSRVDVAFYYSDCGDGIVDSPEQCDLGAANGSAGSCCTATCQLRSSGEVCRPGAGEPCDRSETCTGVSPNCPADDAPINLGAVCRMGSGDVCDKNETCTGVPGQGCPADDAPANTGVTCRVGSVGDFCDQPETCTGAPGATCPADDAPTKVNVVCRPGSGDICDPEERCSGIPGQGCPADVVSNPSTVCRSNSVGDVCDPDETCTAIPGQPCPANVVAPSGTVCRSAAGECDLAEQCSGTAGQTCPKDAKVAAATPCNQDNNLCTVDACDGSGSCRLSNSLDCNDGNACTQDWCDPYSGCEYDGEPSFFCTTATMAKFQVLQSASDTGDRIDLMWRGGPVLLEDMGDPTQQTEYEMCIYDDRGVQVALGVSPGQGWKAVGSPSSPSGFKFIDRIGAQDGVQQIQIMGSNFDRAKLKFSAKGLNVPDTATLPLQYPVTVQVYASDGSCWDAEFDQPDAFKNDASSFGALVR